MPVRAYCISLFFIFADFVIQYTYKKGTISIGLRINYFVQFDTQRPVPETWLKNKAYSNQL